VKLIFEKLSGSIFQYPYPYTMLVLFFDTETNGLPKVKNAPAEKVDNFPRIVQIAGEVWEFSTDTGATPKKLSTHSFIVKPDPALEWDTGSFAIHTISKERALTEGTDSKEVFELFHALVFKCDIIVAHNLAFDKPVLQAEFIRHNLDVTVWCPIEYCTCINTKELLKLPGRYPKPWDLYKMPKLVELYCFLYSPINTFAFHSAAGDVECLVQCFLELVRRRFVPLDTWERNLRVLAGIETS